ncbi:Astacin [Exaiptasia diaphana]|nr:Astacin [Exaiptasia diaphana]
MDRRAGVKQDKVGDTIQKNVEINKNAKVKLCEGDIVCDEDDSQLSKRGAALKIHLWETKVIPYELFGECPRDVASRIEDAMHEIENGTCIKFVKRTTETFWIYFTTASSG